MPTETLTDVRVRGIRHEHGEITDTRSGLIARADKAGAVTFSFRYRSNGARRRIVIGRYPALTLAAARLAVGQLREEVRKGGDPQQDRRRTTPKLTFDALADLYVTNYAKRQKSSWRNDEYLLRANVRPSWGKRDVTSITRQDAARLLFEIVARAPVPANRTRSILVKLFGWAYDSALIDNNPMLGVRKPHRESKGKTRVLRDDELKVVWRALDQARAAPGTIAALRCLLLLGQRPGEVGGMATDELHQLDNGRTAYWELPASRMKARKPHVVPLPPLARQIVLAELARQTKPEFVFAETLTLQLRLARYDLALILRRLIGSLDDNGPDAETVARLKADRPTPHDLRRTCATGMSRLGIPRDDRLAVLAHAYGDVHAIYDHHDRIEEKRAALGTWERHLRKVITGKPASAKIITLAAR